jgi:tetratricopeptide (TPR) repeat protein
LKEKRKFLNPRQKNMLNYQEAVLAGNNLHAHKYMLQEYQQNPKDLLWNGGMMVSALEDVNVFEKTIEIFNEIPLKTQNLEECPYCLERISLAMVAYINLEEYKKALKLIELLPDNLPQRNYYSRAIKVYARLGDTTAINNMIQLASKQIFTNDYRFLYYAAAREFYLINKQELCSQYAIRCIEAFNFEPERTVARAYHLMGELEKSYSIYKKLIDESPDNVRFLGQTGLILARQGNKESALNCIHELETKKQEFDYGLVTYLQGRIYLHLGQKEEAYLKLEKALSQGFKFQSPHFQYDPDLISIRDEPRFQKLIHPLEE